MSRGAQTGVIIGLLLVVVVAALALALPLLREGSRYGVLPGPEWTPPAGTGAPGGTATAEGTVVEPTAAGQFSATVAAAPLNLRSGPGTNTRVVASGQAGQRFQVVGRSADSAWIKLCCVDSQTIWAAAQFLRLDGPVEQAPVADQ